MTQLQTLQRSCGSSWKKANNQILSHPVRKACCITLVCNADVTSPMTLANAVAGTDCTRWCLPPSRDVPTKITGCWLLIRATRAFATAGYQLLTGETSHIRGNIGLHQSDCHRHANRRALIIGARQIMKLNVHIYSDIYQRTYYFFTIIYYNTTGRMQLKREVTLIPSVRHS